MEEMTPPSEVARLVEGSEGSVTYTGESDLTEGRHEFRYDDLVHACCLPDEWEVVGFGKGWFAIEEA